MPVAILTFTHRAVHHIHADDNWLATLLVINPAFGLCHEEWPFVALLVVGCECNAGGVVNLRLLRDHVRLL